MCARSGIRRKLVGTEIIVYDITLSLYILFYVCLTCLIRHVIPEFDIDKNRRKRVSAFVDIAQDPKS